PGHERIPKPSVCIPKVRPGAAQGRMILELSYIQVESDVLPAGRLDLLRQPFPGRFIRSFRPAPERAALRPHVPKQVRALEGDVRGSEPSGAGPGHDDPMGIAGHSPPAPNPR